MPTAAIIAFPNRTDVAGFESSVEARKAASSPLKLVADLVEDLDIRNNLTKAYSDHFIANHRLVKHWLSILTEKGRAETQQQLRQIVSDYLLLQTKDRRTARAYHAYNANLFNAFIDGLTSHLLQEIETQDPKNAVALDLSANNHIGTQVRYLLKTERIRWPEGIENARFIRTRVGLLDIKYRKNSEILVRHRDPDDSFFAASPNHKYWTVASLRGKSQTDGPIILNANRTIIDGHHRVIDAAWNEQDVIDAYIRIKPSARK